MKLSRTQTLLVLVLASIVVVALVACTAPQVVPFSTILAAYAWLCALQVLLSTPAGCILCTPTSAKPARSRHCSVCGVCSDHHSHHCRVLGVCIGAHNRRAFLLFLLITALLYSSTTLISAPYIPTALRAAFNALGTPSEQRARLAFLYIWHSVCVGSLSLTALASVHVWLIATRRVPGDAWAIVAGVSDNLQPNGSRQGLPEVFGKGAQALLPCDLHVDSGRSFVEGKQVEC